MPLLCQIFLSNNAEAHSYLARSGKRKDVLVILVPEHLVSDARTQVFRYCLNLNFREDYRVHDDIFALLHEEVKLGSMKRIFVTSFNLFKKCLTVDSICKKVYQHRENILVIADEVDDFLGTLERVALRILITFHAHHLPSTPAASFRPQQARIQHLLEPSEQFRPTNTRSLFRNVSSCI